MINKVLIFNYTQWNQVVCSLIEGLKLNKNLELYSTTETNYASDISINTKCQYMPVAWKNRHDGPPDIEIHSTVIREDNYVDECKNLMGECDLIIIFDRGNDTSSAHYYIIDEKNKGVPVITPMGRENTVVCLLHEYALDNYKNKIVMINPHDWSSVDKMYGNYKGGHSKDCKVYFKREKSLDLEWEDNVEPIPFASEERYFAAGKNFDKIWDNKDIDVSCLFRVQAYKEGNDLQRGHIRRIVKEHCNIVGNIKNIVGEIYDDLSVDPIEEIERQINGVDISSYQFENDITLGTPRRHHRTYYDILSKTKINIDGLPGAGAFYTGRMMESLANGCCYFYPKPNYRADFPNGLIDGQDFIIYNTPEDLIERLYYYLNHPDEMRVIAENGFNKLLKYHTSEVRAKEFIETCERYMNED
jgi:hypothetical protein